MYETTRHYPMRGLMMVPAFPKHNHVPENYSNDQSPYLHLCCSLQYLHLHPVHYMPTDAYIHFLLHKIYFLHFPFPKSLEHTPLFCRIHMYVDMRPNYSTSPYSFPLALNILPSPHLHTTPFW